MWKATVLLTLLSLSVTFELGRARKQWSVFRNMFKRIRCSTPSRGDPGQPLFLTPYIESGRLEEGRQLSLVGPLHGVNVKSYSGYLTVNKTHNSNLFFWFFPAEVQPEDAPVLLWLQGGPGGSSMFGLFVEHGPYVVDKNLRLYKRKFPWTSKFSMLYIDNPVGTGFSFTDDTGYAVNQDDVGRDLYSALIQFFQLFPDYQKNDFYITGEIFDTLLNGDETSSSYTQNVTGCSNYMNFLQCQEPADQEYFGAFLSLSEVRKAIHVGNLTFHDGSTVEKHLLEDVMKTVKPWLAVIMDNYRVLLYSGQLDIIVAAPLTERFLPTVPWSKVEEYKSAERLIWRIHPHDKEVAGYVRQAGEFYQVIVRGGGHILPYDQPERSLDMMDRFISGEGWKTNGF
ncbi:probable serine carboxypeptidase CPVL isoform X2 [Mauremys mutica]|uniref:probable serine carboxypeptidase CPVL isoform X2 n=1 Tax=Mauremys mutica TaxID=74926 RepID=UPI001D162622|nr:probable serine carboxypeptidase CPVL isoform X2 [Mauremys mutica]